MEWAFNVDSVSDPYYEKDSGSDSTTRSEVSEGKAGSIAVLLLNSDSGFSALARPLLTHYSVALSLDSNGPVNE